MKEISLVDSIFKSKGSYKSAVICTYNLSLHFLEEYLMKLDALSNCEDICIFTDSSTYDGFLSAVYRPRWLNKKYLVNRIETKGVFHSKLYMLVSDKKAVIGIGSNNLTREGMASNLELLSYFEVTEKDQRYASLIYECIEYAERLAEITKSPTASKQVASFRQACAKLIKKYKDPNPALLHNLDNTILHKVNGLLQGMDVEKVQVISPFYDDGLLPLFHLKKALPGCIFEIYLQQARTNFPVSMFDSIKGFTRLFLYHDEQRYIHGKAFFFKTNEGVFLLKGSPNFTYSALLTTAKDGNFELALFGEISKELADRIINFNGEKIQAVISGNNIRVEVQEGMEPEIEAPTLNYIVEAVRSKDRIVIHADPDIKVEQFKPKLIHLISFNEETYTTDISDKLEVTLTAEIKKKVPGKIAVQLTGYDYLGNPLKTNFAWVVELEDRIHDPNVRRMERVFSDPSELSQVLEEILEQEGEEALRFFLMSFDIPLDLVFSPRKFSGKRTLISKGNLLGVIPECLENTLNKNMRMAFEDTMSRLYRKLQAHKESPHAKKIDNFILIYSSLFFIIHFVSMMIYSQLKDNKGITSEKWKDVRDYYDMLFRFLRKCWNLLWGEQGYRDLITEKLKSQEQDKEACFEKYVSHYDTNPIDNWHIVATTTKDHFDNIKSKLKVYTATGKTVKARLFEWDVHTNLRREIVGDFEEVKRKKTR